MSKIESIKHIVARIFNKKVMVTLLLLGIVILSFYLRHYTFWLPHWKGDQNQYVALAMKLEKTSFDNFSLRGVDAAIGGIGPGKRMKLGMVRLADNINSKGSLLLALDKIGVHYYDQPFFHKPPGFPFMLMLSHKIFADENQPYIVVASNLGKNIKEIKPPLFFKVQFWAAIVPLFFSLGVIMLTFFLGKILFSSRVGLYSAFLMAINPVSIMTSQYLLADDMLAFFIASSTLVYVLALKRKNDWLVLLSGLFCGVGVLAKQTGGYFLIAVWIFSIFYYWHKIKSIKSLPKIIFNKHFIFASIGVFLISGFWFLKIYQVYGNPLWRPPHPNVEDVGWFKIVRNRPPGWILFSIGMPWLCPLFSLTYISLRDFALSLVNIFKRKFCDYRFILPWILILVFGFMLRNSHEHRRMIPVYPLLAVLSGYYLQKIIFYRGRFEKFLFNRTCREGVIILLIIMTALWSANIGLDAALKGKMLILSPF